jgi:hypothetical protein
MDIMELHKKYSAKSVDFKINFNPEDFARLLAKIAHGIAVLNYGIGAFKTNYILPIIKGNTRDIDKWIGSEVASKGSEDLSVTLNEVGNDLVAKIRLFGKGNVPSYIVVVGSLKDKR